MYYRKVLCSDRLPELEGPYDTNCGRLHFVPKIDMFDTSIVEWWYEPIEFPSGAFKFVNAQSSDYHLGYNHGVDAVMEFIKGGSK